MLARLLAASVLAAVALDAQDTRSVTEPVFPPVCTALSAQLNAGAGGLPLAAETAFDTGRIQAALNSCTPGQAVELAPSTSGNAFLIQPIHLPPGVTLLVNAGVTMLASRNPRDYDAGSPQSCGTTAAGAGCVALITSSNADGSGIMGYGAIDGRGGTPLIVNGAPSAASWWDVAVQANCPRMVQINGSNNFTLYKITIANAACNFHVAMDSVSNFTAWGVKIIAPYDTPNTVAIATGQTVNNVTIANSYLSEGDDNVAINGATPPGANNISVVNNHFGDGHGASIGSVTNAGVSHVLFQNISISGNTANRNQIALRIKSDVSRGGLVEGIVYRNICIQNSRTVMTFNPFYTAGATGSLIPDFTGIVMQNVHSLSEGLAQIEGHDASVPTGIGLSNVQVDGIKASDVTAQYANVTLGPDSVNFASMLSGTGVSVTNQVTTSNPAYACPASAFPGVAGELVPTAGGVNVQVLPLKEVPYQTYLANLKTNPNATLALAAPTGTVSILDGQAVIATAQLNGATWLSIPLPNFAPGAHSLTASYSGDANYGPIAFGNFGFSTPVIFAGGVGNAASGESTAIAEGSFFSVYGTNLGPAQPMQATTYPLPPSLGGVSVQVLENGTISNAYVVFASATQINAVLPSGVPAGNAQLTVSYNGIGSAPVAFRVAPTMVGIFFQPAGGSETAIAQNADYALNTPATPAKPGDIVILWATGMGPVNGADNVPTGVAGDMTNVPLTIAVGGMPAQRVYAGRQPETAAVDNIYFVVPQTVTPGCQVPVAVTAGGAAANTTTIAISADGSPCR